MLFAWLLGGKRPPTDAAILNGRLSRKLLITITDDKTERGKTAYYVSCYENAKGEAEPWSPAMEAYVG